MKLILTLLASLIFQFGYSQSWQDVGGGTNNSSHGMLVWNNKLINLGSFGNPCNRVAEWDGAAWNCLGGGVGIVARAGVVWDGKLVVVGDFWNVQQPCVGCNGVAVWDGVSWTPLGNGVNNDVLSITVWNNELVIAGDFTQADGVPVARIVKWNGVVWESVGPIGSFDNDIRAMVEFEGDLWVGGDFNNVGGQGPLDGLVKYDPGTAGWIGGNSGVDLIGGVNESVRVLYVNPNDGNLYMGGEFPELIDGNAGVQDFNMSGIAMYDGTEWTPLGTGLNEYCRAIHEYNGDIIAGGYFTDAGGTPANKIAKWDGTSWTAMGQGFDLIGIDEYVKSAAVWNGIFFAGGAYTQAEGNPMNFISQWYEPTTAPPVAWMTSSSVNLCGSGCIDFLDNSTNAPTSWNWTFPGSDTPSSTAQHPGSVCWAAPGTYTVSLQACNAFGCTTQDIDINVENGATVSVNDATICSGSGPVTLTANPSVLGGTYLWAPSGEVSGSISVNPGATTTYDVTYTYLGCSSSATSTVTVTPGSGFNITEDVDACQNSTITYPDATTETITASTSHVSLLTSVSGCDSTVTTNVTMVTAYNQTENISVCENALVTYPDATTETITSSTSHTSNLLSVTGCDSNVVTNVTMAPNYNLNENINACENSTVVYPDGFSETITGNTSHTSILTSITGCDSIIVSNVTMAVAYNMNENINACEGATVSYPDGSNEIITASTSHTSNLTSVQGCDSLIITNVTMNVAYNLSENIDACTNSTVTYPDGFSQTITGNTSHTSNLTTIIGCDSIIVTNVNMVTGYNQSENIAVCENTMVTYPDATTETITSSTSHTSNLLSVTGCDSIIVTNVTMNVAYNLSENINICENNTITYPDGSSEVIIGNTSHTSNLTSSAGCDSVIVSNVTMGIAYNMNENINACEGTTVSYPDGSNEVITASTSHTSNLTSVQGCDSLIITNVTMNVAYNLSENIDACTNSTVTYPDGFSETITGNTSHTSNLTTVIGCDSIIVTNVNMVTGYNQTENLAVCENTMITYPDATTETITSSTSHTSNLLSVTGCDSIIVTNVTMNVAYNLSENINICENNTITYPDGSSEVIIGNTSHTSNLTSSAGCDSVIVSNVTMAVAYNMNENINACEGATVSYPDGSNEIITASTSHTSNLTSVQGCDSLIITNVTMNVAYNLSENIDACTNSSVTYPDGFSETITGNTSHTSNLTTVIGCDSIIVTNVNMVTGYNQTENLAVCENTMVTYPDATTETITSSTSHTSNLLSVTGCDSIIVTNVTMNVAYNLSENINICENNTITYPDGSSEVITGNTSHTSNLTSSAGCDSVIVSNVTMGIAYNMNENINACEGTTVSYPDGSNEVITASTSHTSNLTSVQGCDSLIITNVTMNLNYNTNQNVDVCSGSTYVFPDGTAHTNILVNESYTSSINTVAGCDSIIVTNLSIVSVINITDNISICSGDNYTYPDGTSATNILVDESHTSNLISANGCDSIITSNITVNAIPTLTGNNETICAGETVDLEAIPSIGGGTYSWLPGSETTPIISVSPATNSVYTVVYTLNGCVSNSVDMNVTVNPMPNITTTESNNVITADQTGAQYAWLDCNNGDAVIAGQTNQSYTPANNGSYAVEIDLNGCIDTSACIIISTIGLDELSANNLTIYPNPVSEILHIQSTVDISNVAFEIIDAQGRIIRVGTLNEQSLIDVSTITEGVYTLRLNEGEFGNVRFVKQ